MTFPILSAIILSLNILRSKTLFKPNLFSRNIATWLQMIGCFSRPLPCRFLWLSCLLFHVFAERCQISPLTPLNESCVVKSAEGDPFRPEEEVFEARWGWKGFMVWICMLQSQTVFFPEFGRAVCRNYFLSPLITWISSRLVRIILCTHFLFAKTSRTMRWQNFESVARTGANALRLVEVMVWALWVSRVMSNRILVLLAGSSLLALRIWVDTPMPAVVTSMRRWHGIRGRKEISRIRKQCTTAWGCISSPPIKLQLNKHAMLSRCAFPWVRWMAFVGRSTRWRLPHLHALASMSFAFPPL